MGFYRRDFLYTYVRRDNGGNEREGDLYTHNGMKQVYKHLNTIVRVKRYRLVPDGEFTLEEFKAFKEPKKWWRITYKGKTYMRAYNCSESDVVRRFYSGNYDFVEWKDIYSGALQVEFIGTSDD